MRKILLATIAFTSHFSFSQIFYSNNNIVQVSSGGILHCNGGIQLTNNTTFTNNGNVNTTKNSVNALAGNFEIKSNSTVSGDGIYEVEQDWINDANFSGGASEVKLYGNTEQFISSTNNTITIFNDLTLTGSGTNSNRRKTLQNANAETGISGILTLNDRELNTNTQTFTVNNTAVTAVSNSTTFNAEGFVSSLSPGFLSRKTDSNSDYLFPVGSSDGTLRYRPVVINPNTSSSNTYLVRMNNFSADNESCFLAQHEETIETANNLFYHSIENSTGSSNPNIQLYFNPNTDQDWISFAHWYPEQQWKDVVDATENNGTNYKYITKSNWNFPTNKNQYVLVNTLHPFIIPNVFTPNNDGANDVYSITSLGLKEYNFTILNRWGDVVFETEDPSQSWDGNFKGMECPEGTYFYFMRAKQGSNDIEKHGHITLNRNQ